jgi:hypothetical protein
MAAAGSNFLPHIFLPPCSSTANAEGCAPQLNQHHAPRCHLRPDPMNT